MKDIIANTPDIVMCKYVLPEGSNAFRKAKENYAVVAEAKRRSLTPEGCARLLGRKIQVASSNAFAQQQQKLLEVKRQREAKAAYEVQRRRANLAQERRERELEIESRRKAEAERIRVVKLGLAKTQEAENRRRRELETERQRKAEAERIRIAKFEQAKKQKAEERRQRELVRKRRIADARNQAMAPLRRKNKHSVAVIIGNKNYDGRTPAVDYAHNDADAMRSFVINKLGYRDGNIIDLRDAGRNRIAAVFGNETTHEGELFNIIREGKSDVTVYYSGHGVPGLKDKRPYLLPVNGNPDLAEITGYSVDTLYANLAKLPARSVTVFFDACFSGDSEKGMLVSSSSGLGLEQDIPAASGRLTVITAAQGNQLASWDPKVRHGLFTKHLLDALNGKADDKEYGNADGKVSLAEVQNYLADEMTYQARRTWNRRQNAYVSGKGNAVLSNVLPTQ
jgi:hypothetical protein